MATVEIATGEVIILSQHPETASQLDLQPRPHRVWCIEELEQQIVELGHPVVIIDETGGHGLDLETLILDLAEFDNDRVGGIVVLISNSTGQQRIDGLRKAGANRVVTAAELNQMELTIAEARLERLLQREQRQKDNEF